MAGAERIDWKIVKKGGSLTRDRGRYDGSVCAPVCPVMRKGPEIAKESTIAVRSDAHTKVTSVRSGELEEVHVTAVPHPPGADARTQAATLYAELLERLDSPRSLQIVVERVFGRLSVKGAFLRGRAEALKAAGMSSDSPVTYIEGAPVEGEGLAGVHLTLIRKGTHGVQIDPIGGQGSISGFRVKSGEVCRAYFSAVDGLEPGRRGAFAAGQAQGMFEHADALLRSAGLTYRQVVCTRIYLKRLLEWYDEFNGVRTPYYRELGLMTGEGPASVPASTGIQGKISDDCECFMDVLAVSKGPAGACPFTRLSNPLQNEATDYGSSFARGVRVDVPDVRYVLISGTAAIDENGKSVHLNDPVGQTRRTIANFETILKAGGASPADLYHAVWYCKDPSHAEIVREGMRRHGWPELPCPIVQADVCRHELLVEIDGSAVIAAV